MNEPISPDEARLHLRVDSGAEDALISGYVSAAREWVETYTGILLTQREVTERLDTVNSSLRSWPIAVDQPVTVQLVDEKRVEEIYPDATIDATARPGLLRLVNVRLSYSYQHVAVTFTAGYADPDQIPRVLKQAMLVMLTAFYEDREGGQTFERAVRSAQQLCSRYKRRTL